MAAIQPGMNFYGQMPDSYSLAVNTDHPLIRKISEEAGASLDARIEPLEKQINDDNARITALRGDNATDKEKAEADELVKAVDKPVRSRPPSSPDTPRNAPWCVSLSI